MEETLRKRVEDYYEKFCNHKFVDDAIATFDKDMDFGDIGERRLFFDFLIHDYVIKDSEKSNTTIIQKVVETFKNESGTEKIEKEKKFLELWADSAFRFYEVIDIKKGSGYTVIDIFDNPDKRLFLFDHSSSFTINKHDIIYTRLYNVGEIVRPAGGIVNSPRSFLPFIKEYITNTSQKYYQSNHKTNIETKKNGNEKKPYLNDYFRKESVSIIKYLDSLNSNPTTVTTSQGDPLVLSRSVFFIKNKRRLLSILDSSGEFVELGNEGGTLMYDWVEELDNKGNTLASSSPFLNNIDDNKNINKNLIDDYDDYGEGIQELGLLYPSKELALQTILWVSVDEDKDGSKNINKNTDHFIPYRVLGNLEISGKILEVECLSDSLIFECNKLIQSLAGKYLKHMDNTYKDVSSLSLSAVSSSSSSDPNKELELTSNEYDDIHSQGDDDNVDIRIQKSIENSFKQMIQHQYDDWITTKNPKLEYKTPLEFARTKKGKESIKELLNEMENEFYRNKNNSLGDLPPFPFEKIMKRLGL